MPITGNHENTENPTGSGSLGQITIKPNRQPPLNIEQFSGYTVRIAVNYYGTMHETPPSNWAQLSMSSGGFDASAHLKAHELRKLASQLCEAATAIEQGRNDYDEQRHYGA